MLGWTFLGISGEVWAVIGLFAGLAGVNVANGGNVTYRFVKLIGARRHRRPLDLKAHVLRRKVVGRDEDVAKLRNILQSGGSGAITPVPAVTGGGGVGKTTLARHYSACHAADYDRREFLQAATEDALLRDLANLADRIEGDAPSIPLQQRAIQALQLVTAHTRSETWLIVLDNVETPGAVAKWMPQGRNLHLLITSRHPDWKGNVYETYCAGLLSPDASVRLLEQEAGRSDPDMSRLAEELGYLPLALVQAGEWLAANRRKSAADYMSRLDEYLDERVEDPDREYDRSTAAVVRLTLAGLSADARAVAGILCRFAPDEITEDPFAYLARKRWLARFRGYGRGVPSRVWAIGRNPARLEAVFSELRLKALLEDTGDGGVLRMHRITQQVTRGALRRAAMPDRAAALLAAVYPSGVKGPLNSASWPVCRRLTPHVRALWASGAAPGTAAASFLFNQASIFLEKSGDYEGAADMARAGLGNKIARLPETDRAIALGHANLGQALKRIGALDEAGVALQRAVALGEAHHPGSADLADWYDLHGGLLLQIGRAGDRAALTASLRRHQQAAAIWHRLVGRDSDKRANVLNNLAPVRDALGQRAAGLRLMEYSLAIRRRILAPGDARLGSALMNTGAAALLSGAADRAEPMLEQALALALRQAVYVEAPRHPEILGAAGWLVSCLLVQARAGEDRTGREARAKALCAEYGFVWDQMVSTARQYPYAPGGGA